MYCFRNFVKPRKRGVALWAQSQKSPQLCIPALPSPSPRMTTCVHMAAGIQVSIGSSHSPRECAPVWACYDSPQKTHFSAVWSPFLPFSSLSSLLNSSWGSEEPCPLPPTPSRPRWGPLSAGPHSLCPPPAPRCLTAQETRSLVTLRLTFSLPSQILVQVLRACNKVSH